MALQIGDTAPDFEAATDRCNWLRKRGFGPASTPAGTAGSAQTGTKSGTKFPWRACSAAHILLATRRVVAKRRPRFTK